jgi:hypothetical protein
MKKEVIEQSYKLAKEQYAALGVDTDKVIAEMAKVNISLHCWQTDDVGGFEKPGAELGGGGIQVTGNFPGKAKTIEQMRADLDKVMSLLPGKDLIFMLFMVNLMGNWLIVIRLRQSIFRVGLTGQKKEALALTSIAPVSHIHTLMMVLRYQARMRKSENSGSNTQRDAGLSERRWESSWVHLLFIISGYPMVRKILLLTEIPSGSSLRNHLTRSLQ